MDPYHKGRMLVIARYQRGKQSTLAEATGNTNLIPGRIVIGIPCLSQNNEEREKPVESFPIRLYRLVLLLKQKIY